MYPRVEYEMSKEDLEKLLEAMRPVICIKIGDYVPRSQQENANDAWRALGDKMGFDFMSVRPSEKGDRFFTAIPSETDSHRQERLKKEKEEQRIQEIKTLESEIKERQDKLQSLQELEEQPR